MKVNFAPLTFTCKFTLILHKTRATEIMNNVAKLTAEESVIDKFSAGHVGEIVRIKNTSIEILSGKVIDFLLDGGEVHIVSRWVVDGRATVRNSTLINLDSNGINVLENGTLTLEDCEIDSINKVSIIVKGRLSLKRVVINYASVASIEISSLLNIEFEEVTVRNGTDIFTLSSNFLMDINNLKINGKDVVILPHLQPVAKEELLLDEKPESLKISDFDDHHTPKLYCNGSSQNMAVTMQQDEASDDGQSSSGYIAGVWTTVLVHTLSTLIFIVKTVIL